ncbi:multicopper oxidase domain-containing protein [Deinococcus yavapaiensis]|uniref:FtsP/CotA-like multicopper oxidase with cupredoxin domain n=1 Tax=Deinococcus yavapaiensis KR-236 TaxID=694435 RepID=A0A318S5A2_9DEIO|nr:multicopper oxidase domain-containing protein [Deinococcus yavapaiensis]PYE50993.1 FtsP/CotA-like multicopper oxidase with cupredoxin domain [Deinococcus yavapaiensis KR-236]
MNTKQVQRRITTTTVALAVLGAALTAGFLASASSSRSAGTARDAIINHFQQAANRTVTVQQATGQRREFTIEVHKIHAEIAPGVKVEQWAFGFPGQPPTVPGPPLVVTQGDHVVIHFKNTHDQPHTLHLHGIDRLSQEMDGLNEVLPGQETTYEFVATEAGTFGYHCHFQTYLHADMGMYGAIIVEPKEASARVWKNEHAMILDEWDSRQNPGAAVHKSEPNYFLVNGKSFPLIPDITIPDGQTDLIRVADFGEEVHSLHMHGNSFLIIARNGFPLPQPVQEDTLLIAPGERVDILVKGRDGAFPFHDHIVKDVTNNGIYPGGIHVMLKGSPAVSAYGLPLTNTGDAHSHAMTDMQVDPNADVTASTTREVDEAYPDDSPAHSHVYDHLPKNSPIKVVNIKNFAFDQKELHVKVGTKVAWVNRDAVGHSVTGGTPGGNPKSRAFDSSNEAKGTPVMIGQGKDWTYTFTKKGTYLYYCLPHTNMTAKVIVD